MNNNSGRRRNTRRDAKGKSDLETVVADFVACGRCSFFLAGYRVIHGVEALKQAAEASDEEWLELRWDHQTKHLVQDSYGSRLDIAFYYFDGRCPECQRRFVIDALGAAGEAETELDEEQVDMEEGEWELAEPSTLRVALTSSSH